MSASLVGSEMCIRDRYNIAPGVQSLSCADPGTASKVAPETPEGCVPVSYTHLMLPRICSV
eukprot:6429323-Alexandrium_andersonii.AAC.1